MPLGDIVGELTLIVSAVATLVSALVLPRRLQTACAWLSILALVAAGVLSAFQLKGGQHLTFFGTYAVDDAAVWARIFLSAVAILCVLLSIQRFRGDAREGEYYAMLLFATLGTFALAGAADLMEVVLGVLLTSVASYVLVGYDRGDPRATEAAMKYFLFGALTNAGMLYGFALLFGLSGTTLYRDMSFASREPVLAVAVVLVVAGIGFKLGLVPVHFWVPDVFQGASVAVAAFVSVAPKIAGGIALARFVGIVPVHRFDWPVLVAVLAAVTMTLGNLAAMAQEDVKRLLGYSTISQVGYLLMAVAVIGRVPEALGALLFFLAGYAAANLGAFAVVVESGQGRVGDYAGFARRRPAVAAALVVFLVSLVGIPPLGGFVGKLVVFSAAIDGGFGWLAIVAAANTVASLYYYIRWIAPMYLSRASEAASPAGVWAHLVVGTAVVLTAGIGIGAGWVLPSFGAARLLP